MDLPEQDTFPSDGVGCAPPVPRLERSRSGAPTLKVVAADGNEKHLHSCYDPVREARDLVGRFDCAGRAMIVVLGLGLGYHVAEILSRFPDAEIVVIEALPECARLARLEHGAAFASARVSCLAGLSPDAALQAVTERQLRSGMPPLALFALPAAVAAFPDYYRPLREKLAATCALDLGGRLRYRKFGEGEARVLLFDCGYFLAREAVTALRQLGHRVDRLLFDEKTPPGELLARLIAGIVAARPDFCLTINHLGFDEEGMVTQFLRSIEMPAASWFVDSPDLIVKGFDRNISPFTSLFVWDAATLPGMRKAGFESVSYLPLATDPAIFRPLPGNAPEVARLAAPVGFVGNSMVARLQGALAKTPPHLHSLVENAAPLMEGERRSLSEVFASMDATGHRMLDGLGARERLAFETAVTWRATLLYRRDCIEQLRGFRPVIHGDEGWHALLDADFTVRPPLDYYRDLPSLYNGCTVNFNATNRQMGSAVNQRIFDVPACGGFLLTDHQESLEELFAAGDEVVTYRDKAEIPGLLRFYIGNPAAREKVARRARERVLRQHTYRHRLEELVAVMKSRYG